MGGSPEFIKDQIIEGHRVVRPTIGKGGFGVVHEAVDPEGRRCALKILNSERSSEDFKNEYKNLVGIHHPHVADAFHFGLYDGRFFLSSEFVEGEPLVSYSRGKKPDILIPLFIQVLEGLDFIHRNGLLHFDIKSENIIVTEKAGKPHAVIIDFGVAMDPKNYDGSCIGSPLYIAPEIVLGEVVKVDARADLFSCGVLMYYCLTWGCYPFFRFVAQNEKEKLKGIIAKEVSPPPPSSHKRIGIPKYLDTIVLRLLAKDPDDRFYTNARAVINALLTHKPDAFAGSVGSYLLPPRGTYIGQEKTLKEIREQLSLRGAKRRGNPPLSLAYTITGERGLGKTAFLQRISIMVELMPEGLRTVQISLPASQLELDAWAFRLRSSLEKADRGTVILVDDLDHLELCDEAVQKKMNGILNNLLTSISDRRTHPELFEEIKPIMLFVSHCERSEAIPRVSCGRLPRPFGARNDCRVIPLAPFTTKELSQYLKTLPAFRDTKIPDGWIKNIWSATNGNQGEIYEHLKQMDQKGCLFDQSGKLILPEKIGTASTPPILTKERLLNSYHHLGTTEKEILKLISVWNWKGITRPIQFEDLANFLYSSVLLQNIENLKMKGILTRRGIAASATPPPSKQTAGRRNDIKIPSPLRGEGQGGGGCPSPSLVFTNSYLPDLIYTNIHQEDREQMHDQIADYLKSDTDAQLLHRGYGSDKAKALRSLIVLGRKQLYEKGKTEMARDMLIDAQKITYTSKMINHRINLYTSSLILSSHFYCADHSALEEYYHTVTDNVRGGSLAGQYWKLRQSMPMIESLIRTKRISDALLLITSSKKTSTEMRLHVLSMIFENYEARVLYEESFEQTENAHTLLDRSSAIYSENYKKTELLTNAPSMLIISNDLGAVLKAQQKYEDAIQQLITKFEFLLKKELIFGVMETLLSLTDTYRQIKDFVLAKKSANHMLKLAAETGNAKWLIYGNQALINIFHDNDEFEEAIKSANRCIAISSSLSEKTEYEDIAIRLWYKMGHCYKELKQYPKAAQFFEAVTGAVNNIFAMSAYVGLGEISYYTKDFAVANQYLNKAEKLIGKFPDKSHLKRIAELRQEIVKITDSTCRLN